MNINKKYIIIFGSLILLLIIITGAITYYKENAEQAQISDEKQPVISFSRNYPATFDELANFINFCKNLSLSDIEGLKNNEGIREVGLFIVDTSIDFIKNSPNTSIFSNSFVPVALPLESFISFNPGLYIGISVNLKDALSKYNPSLLEEEKLYFCSISEPSLVDPLILQLESKYDLFFDEGSVSCSGIEMDKTPVMIFLGVVPQAESLSIKDYLVDEQTASNVLSKGSFSEMKDILNDYPVIWQMEKPITF